MLVRGDVAGPAAVGACVCALGGWGGLGCSYVPKLSKKQQEEGDASHTHQQARVQHPHPHSHPTHPSLLLAVDTPHARTGPGRGAPAAQSRARPFIPAVLALPARG